MDSSSHVVRKEKIDMHGSAAFLNGEVALARLSPCQREAEREDRWDAGKSSALSKIVSPIELFGVRAMFGLIAAFKKEKL